MPLTYASVAPGVVSPRRPVPASIARPEYVDRPEPRRDLDGDVKDHETIEKMRVAGRVAALDGLCSKHGRSLRELSVAVAVADGSPDMLPELARVGVTELVVVATPPADPANAVTWVQELAAQWGVTPGR